MFCVSIDFVYFEILIDWMCENVISDWFLWIVVRMWELVKRVFVCDVTALPYVRAFGPCQMFVVISLSWV